MNEHNSPKRRGGQPGNSNAIKHGFYSKHLDRKLRREIKNAAALTGPDADIALMRMKIADIVSSEPKNHGVLMRAVSTLAKLLRLKHQRGGNGDRLLQTRINVMREVGGPLGFGLSDDGELISVPRLNEPTSKPKLE